MVVTLVLGKFVVTKNSRQQASGGMSRLYHSNPSKDKIHRDNPNENESTFPGEYE